MSGFVGIVLAAGYGARLKPLTDERPKPAIPVFNRPMAAFSLSHLASAGARALAVNTHHRAAVLENALEPSRALLPSLTFGHEPVLLGTGGGVRGLWPLLSPRPDELVVVMNGDILFEPDLAAALSVHRVSDAVATMVVRRAPLDPRGHALGVSVEAEWPHESGRVTRVLGSADGDAASKREPVMFTGVHILSQRAHAGLPETGCIIHESYRRWLRTEETVAAVFDESPFADLGTLDDYLDTHIACARGQSVWSGRVELVGVGAQLDAVVVDSVVGADARVRADVAQSVVWDGATVDRPVRRAIVTPSQVVTIDRPS